MVMEGILDRVVEVECYLRCSGGWPTGNVIYTSKPKTKGTPAWIYGLSLSLSLSLFLSFSLSLSLIHSLSLFLFPLHFFSSFFSRSPPICRWVPVWQQKKATSDSGGVGSEKRSQSRYANEVGQWEGLFLRFLSLPHPSFRRVSLRSFSTRNQKKTNRDYSFFFCAQPGMIRLLRNVYLVFLFSTERLRYLLALFAVWPTLTHTHSHKIHTHTHSSRPSEIRRDSEKKKRKEKKWVDRAANRQICKWTAALQVRRAKSGATLNPLALFGWKGSVGARVGGGGGGGGFMEELCLRSTLRSATWK